MTSRFTKVGMIAAALVAVAGTANAQAITPAGTFGSLPANSFGGSGIPTNAVMLGGGNGATIGLSATQRYTSPAVTNDGAGTYFAASGESTGGASNTGMAAWNFDYFVGNPNPTDVFTLYVDTDPATGNSLTDFGTHSFTLGILPGYVDSSNLGYLWWTFPFSFNPSANGEYSFAIDQTDVAGNQVGYVAMNVEVGTTTPEPSSLALLGSGFIGLAGFVKRRARLV